MARVIVDSAAVSLVHIRQPLALISQVQRSGGTLLSQLFDGHPQVHAHPGELHIGPGKSHWPGIRLDESPEQWFDRLFERITLEFIEEGYSKTTQGAREAGTFDVFPFRFDPDRQREIFFAEAAGATTKRAVLDAYMTSYFNAWLDDANLGGDKRWVTAFSARLAMNKADLAAFLDDYADGRLITIVREPRGWFESSRRYSPRYEDVERAVKTWRRSTRSSLDAKKRYGARVFVLSFERLVRDTEATMRRLCEYLGLTFSEELLTPTFNGLPIRADSSRGVESYGVVQDRAEPPPLDPATEETLEAGTAELYERAFSRMD
jgi:hypothetical protein